MVKPYLRIWIRLLVLATGIFALLYIFNVLVEMGRIFFDLLTPFIAAAIIAFLIDPIVNFFEIKLRLKRGWAVFGTLILLFSTAGVLLILCFSRITYEATKLYQVLPKYYELSPLFITETIEKLRNFFLGLPEPILEGIRSNMFTVFNTVSNALKVLLGGFIQTFASIPQVVTVVIISLLATFFISKDKRTIINFFSGSLSRRFQRHLADIKGEVVLAVGGYLRSLTILVTITAVTVMIGLTIIGVEYAFMLGLLTGLLDVLPIIGPGLLFVPWIVWLFINGNFKLGVAILLLYGIISVVRQFLEPKIMASQLGLHPLIMLIAMYVGAKLFGVLGIILGPFIAIILKAMVNSGMLPSLPKN